MDFSKRNKKVALSRWKNLLKEQQDNIPKNKQALLIKSALCGFLAGDGSVQVRKFNTFSKYQIDFFADDKIMLNTFLTFIKKIYCIKPSVHTRDNMYVARLSYKFVVLDLLSEASFGLKKWNFPKKLFKIKGAKENWLRAFFSAEGYVNNKVIKIQSVSIKSIKIVSRLLSELHIKNNYYEYQPKNVNHSKVGMIFINERESRLNYFNKIGFWHSRKENKLKEADIVTLTSLL